MANGCFCSCPDDLHETKNTLGELSRRYHEMEIEVRRLENEREELSSAYREAEAVSYIRVLREKKTLPIVQMIKTVKR
jgi:hypothetical protein